MPGPARRAGRRAEGVGVAQRLLDVSDRLFYTDGVQAVGIDRLLRESGVAKASLYANFPSKDALVAAYLGRRHAEYRERVQAAVSDGSLTPRQRVLHIFDAHTAWVESAGFRGCPFLNVAGELSGDGHPAHAVTAAHRAWLHDTLTTLVRDSGLPAPGLLAGALLVLLDGATATALLDADPGAAADARWAAARLLGDSPDGRSPHPLR